jgi:tetratricopeptide (TPR) repeat protein
MTDEQLVEQTRSTENEAIDLIRRNHRQQAEHHLSQAAQFCSQIQDMQVRRKQSATLALLMVELQFAELANIVAREAIELDHQLDDTPHFVEDLLTYGWSLHLMGRHIDAAEHFRQARDLALGMEAWHNAASATSNLAAAIAAEGGLNEALELLHGSLTLLERESRVDTQIRTRTMMIRVMNALMESPESCFDEAREILNRFGQDMNPRYHSMVREALDAPLRRFFAAHANLDPRQWVPQTFPELMEE